MKLQILVVEDDANILEIVSIYLKSLGHKVMAVDSGEKALEIMAKSKPDLIITDFNLGSYKMNGQELLLKAKEMYPTLHVVLMTAFHEAKGAVIALKCGAFDYLCKPFNLTDFDKVISAVVYDKQSVKTINEVEKEHIVRVLADAETYDKAAVILGINMATLWRKRKVYNITKSV